MLKRILLIAVAVLALTGRILADASAPPQVPAVPEPATLLLLGSGLAVAAYGLRKARKPKN